MDLIPPLFKGTVKRLDFLSSLLIKAALNLEIEVLNVLPLFLKADKRSGNLRRDQEKDEEEDK